MKYAVSILVATVLFLAGCASLKQSLQPSSQQLSVGDIIELTKAGASDEVIMSQIEATGSYFKLSVKDIETLREAGVSNKVIEYMIDTKIRGFRYYTYPWEEHLVYASPFYHPFRPVPSLLHPRYRCYRPWVYGGIYRGYYTPYYLPWLYYYAPPLYQPAPYNWYDYKNPYYYRWPILRQQRPTSKSK